MFFAHRRNSGSVCVWSIWIFINLLNVIHSLKSFIDFQCYCYCARVQRKVSDEIWHTLAHTMEKEVHEENKKWKRRQTFGVNKWRATRDKPDSTKWPKTNGTECSKPDDRILNEFELKSLSSSFQNNTLSIRIIYFVFISISMILIALIN